MAVEGKTILQTTERTELTGKEGIPFQEGVQNGHVLVERLKEHVGKGLVKEDDLKTINGEKLTGKGDITIDVPGAATTGSDGLMSKEDKAKVDGIQFNANENSILFGGKRYVAFHLKRVETLTESSTSEDIASVIGEATEDNFSSIKLYIARGGLFIVQDNWREYAAVANYNSMGEARLVQFDYIANVSNKYVEKRIKFGFDGSAWSFKTFLTEIAPVANSLSSSSVTHALSAAMGKKLQDEKLAKTDVVNNLTTTDTSKALSAAQGKALNGKIAEISNPASAEKDGLMSKEDKEAFDNMKDGGAIEYKEISGQTVDANDLIVPKLTVRYLNKNASTAENISNIPAKGGFVLESMCVRYVDEGNCGYIQTYYSQNSDSRILPFSLTRQYTNGTWTEWRSTVGRYLCVNEAYEKVGTTFLGTGFQVGNIFDRSIVKDGALAISTQDVAIHLTGAKNSTTYKVVGNASVGYWMMKNCPEQFFHAGRVAVSEDKTSESDETKKEYVAEVVSVDAEGGTVTFSKSLNPYTDFNDYSASFKAYAENGSLCLSAGTSTFLGIAGEECVAGAESADGCVALGDRCVSTGGCSVALCWQTVARNFAETALGISNKSHKGDSADKQTLFSIGNGTQWFNDWGTAKQKNAMEVMKNGDVYIEGVGGYDGINDGFTAQSVQDVISGLLSEVSALKEEIEALKGSGA